mmetsp:Transcript_20489/g.57992  ORF Transcript_20489/g.57992 Transcript_20489/m.57992 type:complete len:196 (-) Transcript_20489:148-735(-)
MFCCQCSEDVELKQHDSVDIGESATTSRPLTLARPTGPPTRSASLTSARTGLAQGHIGPSALQAARRWPSTPPGKEEHRFQVRLVKRDHEQRVGLDIARKGPNLKIKAIKAGLAQDWNLSCDKSQRICVGDIIVCVNDAWGTADSLLEAFNSHDELTLTIHRRLTGSMTPRSVYSEPSPSQRASSKSSSSTRFAA